MRPARAIVTIFFCTAAIGCTALSGVGDLQVEGDGIGGDPGSSDDDGGDTQQSSSGGRDGSSTTDGGGSGSRDSSADVDSDVAIDSSTPDTGPVCGPISSASITTCSSDAALSPSIVTCRQFCASQGRCCAADAASCTIISLPVAGVWSSTPALCNTVPDYELVTCDDVIRGTSPGYFGCCCY